MSASTRAPRRRPAPGKKAPLHSGAEAVRLLMRRIARVRNVHAEQLGDCVLDQHQRADQFVELLRLAESSVVTHLLSSDPAHRRGFLVGLVDVLAMAADGVAPAANWSPRAAADLVERSQMAARGVS